MSAANANSSEQNSFGLQPQQPQPPQMNPARIALRMGFTGNTLQLSGWIGIGPQYASRALASPSATPPDTLALGPSPTPTPSSPIRPLARQNAQYFDSPMSKSESMDGMEESSRASVAAGSESSLGELATGFNHLNLKTSQLKITDFFKNSVKCVKKGHLKK